MSRVVSYLSVLVTVWCMLSTSVEAQQLSCNNATAMANVNTTLLVGTWFEVVRSPEIDDVGCVDIDLRLYSDDQTLNISVTYVDPTASSWQNMTISGNVTLNNTDSDGFNVTFYMQMNDQKSNRTLKLLDTDYANYAIICGYTDPSNDTTAFGAILTRQRMANFTLVKQYQQKANASYVNFNTMANITQTDKCYQSGASTTLPTIATAFALIYALIKYMY